MVRVNSREKLVRVSYADLQQDISRASFSHQIERVLFRASFSCEFLVRVSRASVMGLNPQSESDSAFLVHCHVHHVCVVQMYKYRRTDFIETNLKPALVEACSHQVALIDSSLTQFMRYRDRLKVVREEKRKLKLEMELVGE